jgi:hypothetical protein
MHTRLWLAGALAQAVAVGIAGRAIWRRGERNAVLGPVRLALGAAILAASVAWPATGSLCGRSPIGMRGGAFEFGLSMLTALEITGLGVLALAVGRRGRG